MMIYLDLFKVMFLYSIQGIHYHSFTTNLGEDVWIFFPSASWPSKSKFVNSLYCEGQNEVGLPKMTITADKDTPPKFNIAPKKGLFQ